MDRNEKAREVVKNSNKKFTETAKNYIVEYNSALDAIAGNIRLLAKYKRNLDHETRAVAIKLKGLQPCQPTFEFEKSAEWIVLQKEVVKAYLEDTTEKINAEIEKMKIQNDRAAAKIDRDYAELVKLGVDVKKGQKVVVSAEELL